MLAGVGWLFRPAPPRYAVTDIGVLPGDALSHASGLNNQGDVVGLSGPDRRPSHQHSFLYRDGVLSDLGQFRLFSSHNGPAINDRGQITGTARVHVGPLWRNHVFLYDASGMHDLGPPGGSMGMGEAINVHGQIVGETWGNGPGVLTSHAFLENGGRMTGIGAPPGSGNVTLTGINASGQIIGSYERQAGGLQAFVCDTRTRKMTALASPPGMDSHAQAINDRGQIIGFTDTSNQKERAVLWTGDRTTDLGHLTGLDNTSGAALNNRGEAVGTAWAKPGGVAGFVNDHPIRLRPLLPLFQQNWAEFAFVYRDGRMQDLNALIPARSGWTLEDATGINDRGQIVGHGLHRGQDRAFLLTPVR